MDMSTLKSTVHFTYQCIGNLLGDIIALGDIFVVYFEIKQ